MECNLQFFSPSIAAVEIFSQTLNVANKGCNFSSYTVKVISQHIQLEVACLSAGRDVDELHLWIMASNFLVHNSHSTELMEAWEAFLQGAIRFFEFA